MCCIVIIIIVAIVDVAGETSGAICVDVGRDNHKALADAFLALNPNIVLGDDKSKYLKWKNQVTIELKCELFCRFIRYRVVGRDHVAVQGGHGPGGWVDGDGPISGRLESCAGMCARVRIHRHHHRGHHCHHYHHHHINLAVNGVDGLVCNVSVLSDGGGNDSYK